MTLSDDVSEHMGSIVASDPKLLAECESICQIYSITPETLKYKWEALNFSAYSSKLNQAPPFTMDSIKSLKGVLQRDLQKQGAVKKGPRKMPASSAANVNRARLPANFARNMLGSGGVQVKVEGVSDALAGPSKAAFKGPKNDSESRKKRAYHYMYEKVTTRSLALDDRIIDLTELVGEHYKIPDSDFGDPSSSTDEEVMIVGRITQDSDLPSSSAKLTDSTVTIECSRYHALGARIPLRFDSSLKIRGGAQGAGGLGLFPGAIVAAKGKNGGGGTFLASELFALPPLTPYSLRSLNPKPDPGSAFSMCISCGPYTPDTDLDYRPWRALLLSIEASRPAVVVLTGPFVDAAHPMIKLGDIDVTPLRLFQRKIIEPLRAFLDSSPGSIAVVIPNVRDIVSFHNVYPQAEFGPEVSSDHRIHLLPNPAQFTINNMKFAATSVDVVFHLRKEELMKKGEEVESIPRSSPEDTGADAMGNLCRHLLQQRSFYPIFPVPYEATQDVNLDVSHSEGLRMDEDDCAPDVLIVPSRLKQFAKNIHSTTAVNPSFLTKGTYAMLNVDPTSTERVKVEMIKLEG